MELIVVLFAGLVFLISILKSAVIVPQQCAYVVERLGRFQCTLDPGLHIVAPYVDIIRYRFSLKETTEDLPGFTWVTKDNHEVVVETSLTKKIVNPARAAYVVEDFNKALRDIAEQLLRAELDQIALSTLSRINNGKDE